MRPLQEIANAVPAGHRECGSCGKLQMRLLWEIANVAPLGNGGLKILTSSKLPKSSLWKTYPREAPGRALARTGAKGGHSTIEAQNHRATGPKKLSKS